jgi:translocator protein
MMILLRFALLCAAASVLPGAAGFAPRHTCRGSKSPLDRSHRYGSFSNPLSLSVGAASNVSRGSNLESKWSGATVALRKQGAYKSRSCRPSSLSALPTTTLVTTAAGAMITRTTGYYALAHVLIGTLGVPFVNRAVRTWYPKIVLPQWTPPNRVFGPVWTVLYASMGVALSRIVSRLTTTTAWWQTSVGMWWIGHLLLNVAWAPAFFGWKRLRIGLAINYGLLATLCGCILPQFAASDVVSATLLIPYVVWLLFATALNQAICQRNPVTGKSGYNNAMLQADLIDLQKKAAIYAGL